VASNAPASAAGARPPRSGDCGDGVHCSGGGAGTADGLSRGSSRARGDRLSGIGERGVGPISVEEREGVWVVVGGWGIRPHSPPKYPFARGTLSHTYTKSHSDSFPHPQAHIHAQTHSYIHAQAYTHRHTHKSLATQTTNNTLRTCLLTQNIR
jgi:hypothetical protein